MTTDPCAIAHSHQEPPVDRTTCIQCDGPLRVHDEDDRCEGCTADEKVMECKSLVDTAYCRLDDSFDGTAIALIAALEVVTAELPKDRRAVFAGHLRTTIASMES